MKKLGFGAMRLPLIDPQDKSSIDIEELKRMIDTYMAAGFTYFDTAFPYHEQLSENALKEALVDRYDRDSYVLADKMPTVLIKSGMNILSTLISSLKRLVLNILITILCTIWEGTDILTLINGVALSSQRE